MVGIESHRWRLNLLCIIQALDLMFNGFSESHRVFSPISIQQVPHYLITKQQLQLSRFYPTFQVFSIRYKKGWMAQTPISWKCWNHPPHTVVTTRIIPVLVGNPNLNLHL